MANVLRRRRNSGLLPNAAADAAFASFATLPISLWPFAPLARRSWDLGANLTSYDAAYVALAELLAAPLITLDGRLTRAPGIRCRVEHFE